MFIIVNCKTSFMNSIKYSSITLNCKQMNLDFLLFAGPKIKYKFVDLWGEVIFIPSYSPLSKLNQQKKHVLSDFVNCYKTSKSSQVQFSIKNALSDIQGQQVISQSDRTTISNGQQQSQLQQQITHHIPCLFLNSLVKSKYLILYFHASGEDIKIAQKLLEFIRNSYQVNVLAMQYQGYSIYQGSTSSETVKKDAKTVYKYVIQKLGFQQENIIVIGRSIGTGVALELLKLQQGNKSDKNIMYSPRALALVSPFASVKDLAKQYVGKLGNYLAKQHYNNLQNIADVKCPVFIVHGAKDSLISLEHSKQLIQKCKTRKILLTPTDMTHSSFDYYSDLIDPLRQFLLQEGINFYEQNMNGPIIPEQLYLCPESFPL